MSKRREPYLLGLMIDFGMLGKTAAHFFVAVILMMFLQPFALAGGMMISERLQHADTIKSSDFTTFQSILRDIESESHTLSTKQQIYLNYLNGYEQGFVGNFDVSMRILQSVVHESEDMGLSLRAQSTLLNILTIQGRFTEAFILADDIAQHALTAIDPTARLHALRVVSLLYNQSGLYEESLYYSTLALQKSDQARDACAAQQLIMESYYRLQQAEYIELLYPEAVASCQQAGDLVFESLVHYFYIRYLIEFNDLELAEELLIAHSKKLEKVSYEALFAYYHALKAQLSFLLNDFYAAEASALQVTTRTEASKYYESHVIANKVLFQLHERQENFESALYHHKKLLLTLSQYRDTQSERTRSFHETRAVMQAKNQQIELLSKDNELLYLEQQVLNKEAQNARLLLGFFLLLLFVLGIFAYRGLVGRHRFKFMAENDELTGISNRYHFNKLAERALQHCKKRDMTVGVILFDLDHFKQINDKFGHATGDWVLQQVVRTCRNFMRLDDVFGRLGGEEFAILLPGCHADKALMLAEICRDAIEEINTKPSSYEFRLTASFGVTSSDNSGFELKQLLADADKAMYKAKQSGRNQVHFFSGPSEPSSVAGTSSS
ncbi:GGDEF domain-containing protein [Alkalimonas mucilaginosa]|uniref:diguanylate cyclase n=1 Tax=Alkalimonas mucilaginosa TaxID=3057676 RepID=A0ABU7JDJ9_9GAMM|nr:GGDEF domain-containing protein [Alkalimonas sp. MEB004]MEE2023776.1 GGDEF domain-containing protein [Alkalimonas sp. MEB004]